MPEAARVLDQVSHTSALAGLIIGAVAGAVIGALIVGTGGTAAVALATVAVSACSYASLGGMIGQLAGSLLSFKTGPIMAPGAVTVLIEGRCAARVSDLVACRGQPLSPIPHPGVPIAQGSTTVRICGLPAARKGDLAGCEAKIAEGSSKVLIGGPTGTYLPIDREVPLWLELGIMGLGLLGGIGAVALVGRGLRVLAACRLIGSLVGGFALGKGGYWLGGKLFGEGSFGQKMTGLLGTLGGSFLGGRLAGSRYVYEPLSKLANQRLVQSANEVLPMKIPKGASVRPLKGLEGAEYKFQDIGPHGKPATIKIRIHGPDSTAPPGNNSATTWTATINNATGRYRMLPDGKWVDLETATDAQMNELHIPILK